MIGKLDLTRDDVHDLIDIIDARMAELQDELVHTDDRRFREAIRDAENRLAKLRERVHHLAPDLPARAEPSALARRVR